MLTLPAPVLPAPVLSGGDAPSPMPLPMALPMTVPADGLPTAGAFADLIALTAGEGEDAPVPDALMLDAPPAPPEPPPPDLPASAQPWAFVLVPELAHLPAPVVADPAEGEVEGDTPWPRRALPGLVPDGLRAAPRAANWQATLPAIAAPLLTAPVSPSPAPDPPLWSDPAGPPPVMPAALRPDPIRPALSWPEPTLLPSPPAMSASAPVASAFPTPADAPAAMVNPPPPLVNAVQPLAAGAPISRPALRREEVSETSDSVDAGPAIAAPAQPLSAQAAPLAARAAAPLPPATPPEPAPGPAMAIASDRLGEVAVRLNGSAENLQVSLQAQPAAAVLIGAETQRLQQDMANAGVSLSALSINGQRADLGNGQQGRPRSQPRRDAMIAATRAAPSRITPTADRFA